MKTQKLLTKAMVQVIAFFSSLQGMAVVMLTSATVNALMDGFAVGRIFGERLEQHASTNIHWWSFAFGFVITLCLSASIMVTFLSHKIQLEGLEKAKLQIAKMKNARLLSLGKTLCNFSIVISLMSVGIFMFDGISFEQLKAMAITPLFWCQIFLFICIAFGTPKSIVRFCDFIYVKHYAIIDKINKMTTDSINEMLDNDKPKETKKDKPKNTPKAETVGKIKYEEIAKKYGIK